MKKTYITTKMVHMIPMTRQEYNDLRKWSLPANENGDDAGYLIENLEGGEANVPGYTGYVSWSPKAQTDKSYREVNGLTLGMAMEAVKKGYAVARKGWNGVDMFIYYVPAGKYPAHTGVARAHFGSDALVPYNSYLAIKTSNNTVSPWAPSGSDAIGDDWFIVMK